MLRTVDFFGWWLEQQLPIARASFSADKIHFSERVDRKVAKLKGCETAHHRWQWLHRWHRLHHSSPVTPVKFADFTGDRNFTGEVHRPNSALMSLFFWAFVNPVWCKRITRADQWASWHMADRRTLPAPTTSTRWKLQEQRGLNTIHKFENGAHEIPPRSI